MKHPTFVYPTNTKAVSLTGSSCAMKCPWCEGRYLKNMLQLPQIGELPAPPESLLISGGWNAGGQIPWEENFPALKRLREGGIRLNLHFGIFRNEKTALLKELSPLISYDFLLDDELLQLSGFGFKTAEVLKSYEALLATGLEVVPHLLLGRNRGRLSGDFSLLETLAAYRPQKAVFLIFIPTPGTAFETFFPPEIEQLEKIFSQAREKLPQTALILGCMRPGGAYRIKIDRLALKHQFNKIVMPAPQIRKTIPQALIQSQCCAFD